MCEVGYIPIYIRGLEGFCRTIGARVCCGGGGRKMRIGQEACKNYADSGGSSERTSPIGFCPLYTALCFMQSRGYRGMGANGLIGRETVCAAEEGCCACKSSLLADGMRVREVYCDGVFSALLKFVGPSMQLCAVSFVL